MSMTQLLQRFQAGDAAAAQSLVELYQAEVYRLALSILNDPKEAEDAMQDAFIAAIAAIETYRGDSAFKTWLFSITINLCRKRWGKRKRTERLLNTLQTLFRVNVGPAHPEEIVIRREARTTLWKAIDALGEKQRLPIILYYVHDLPVAEIAVLLKLPQGTVLSRLHTGRERLRTLLKGNPEFHSEAGEG